MSQSYDIKLRIAFRYDHPAGSHRTLLRILPRSIEGQQHLLYGLVTTEPRRISGSTMWISSATR